MSRFLVKLCFSGTIKARALNLDTSILNNFMSRFLVKLCFSGTIKARALNLDTSIQLVEGS